LLAALLSIVGPAWKARAQAGSQGPDAARGPVALHWVRLPETEDCISGDALARVVEIKLRRNVFPAPRDASILIEGHVRKTADGFAAALVMRDQSGKQLGSRELSSQDKSCHELSETLGVVLAVMIDPDAAKRPPSPLPPGAEAAAAKSAARADQEHNRTLVFGRVLAGITDRPLYGFGGAYERALGVAGGLRLEVAFFAENTTKIDIGAPEKARAVVRVIYVGVAYCPLWLQFSRARLAGCAGLEVGGGRGHDNDFPLTKADQAGWWASGSASLRLSVVLVRGLEAHFAGGLAGAFGDHFVVKDQHGDKKQILPKSKVPLGGQFDLGLGARF
jgi:hypothetical protein